MQESCRKGTDITTAVVLGDGRGWRRACGHLDLSWDLKSSMMNANQVLLCEAISNLFLTFVNRIFFNFSEEQIMLRSGSHERKMFQNCSDACLFHSNSLIAELALILKFHGKNHFSCIKSLFSKESLQVL